ncbi:hypothetical protein [Cryobacterium psychrophilum]|uniref:Uncharacterized protein n=1 Tax=Cryobacterium psychrophilum TaxID=41988 RepID=A0A4Y8KQA9_9MICO|nr:hypothetical protein [Cryobacterium psychrophilum]TDW28902.1 hypothetical protein EDD25_0568 [Cryobacterium psychrophilum]TFD81096.1 hypothetical protein E3T53_03735 [Cryobacterium psychrophilum]
MATRTVTASEGIDLLSALGVNVIVRDADTVTLGLDGRRTIARVHVRRSPPSRWDIRRDVDSNRARDAHPGILLYVVPKATAALADRAVADPTIAVVSVQDRVVILRGKRMEEELPGVLAARQGAAPTQGRVAWGRYALLRVLLRTPRPRTQMDLAAECGVSQVTISNSLRTLDTAVVRDEGGWRALRPETLWSQFLAEYPGPQGITSYWLGLDPIVRQAKAVRDASAAVDGLVSGDPAADTIAPWRVGSRAVVYARTGLDLARLGFSETTRENATLDYVVPADPTIWSTARAWSSTAPVWTTDPVLVAWDVQRTGGPDAADAVERIRRTVLAGWLK